MLVLVRRAGDRLDVVDADADVAERDRDERLHFQTIAALLFFAEVPLRFEDEQGALLVGDAHRRVVHVVRESQEIAHRGRPFAADSSTEPANHVEGERTRGRWQDTRLP
jgi:hypothetical protein